MQPTDMVAVKSPRNPLPVTSESPQNCAGRENFVSPTEEIGNGGQKATPEGNNFSVAAGGVGKSVEAVLQMS
jgi:hypothetical protein